MTIKPKSGKNKGQKFQKEIVTILRTEYGFDKDEMSCFEGDIQARPMGMAGVDIVMSPAAKRDIPFDFEAKNTERANVWDWIKQTESNSVNGRIPLVVFRRNRSETYCILKFDDLIKLDLGGY
jgi:hypothetical protein